MTVATVQIHSGLQFLKGVGPARAQALSQAGIDTVEDLLYYFPRRHLDRTVVTPIQSLVAGETATVVGKIVACGEKPTRRRKLFQAILSDGTGQLNLVWFRGVDYMKRSMKIGDQLAASGKVDFYGGFQMVHPEYDKLNAEDDPLNSGKIVPLYPLTAGLKKVRLDQRPLRRILQSVLSGLPEIPDLFPPAFLQQYGLTSRDNAFRWIHFANSEDQLTSAVHRFKFDEHFFLQLLMALRRKAVQSETTTALPRAGKLVKAVFTSLAFSLTAAQKRVLSEIRQDLAKTTPMNRLLQGDVGSGKTVVAVFAAVIAVENGVQAAIMAPTEILARQHFQSFSRYLEAVNIPCALLVGKTASAERKKLLEALREGRLPVVVGTHALIQDDVAFQRLGLVIIDEQHRFGVVQRGNLLQKGYHPHVLAMTATPIPRTLALSYHGDMDVSVIDEMPRNRQPVITRVVLPERLDKVYQFIRDQIAQGRQAMIVYPLVEESEKSDLAAAVKARESLAKTEFKAFPVGLLHGRQKKEEKETVMTAFAENRLPVLIATTVIEVGIDIPNATVMMIEHADRFGLTQLHQLRGRVGRGTDKGYCILVKRNHTEIAERRLKIMEETTDGFAISDADLKLRGPGEFFGLKQSGFIRFKIADLVHDGLIIRQARQAAFDLIKRDSHLRHREHLALRNHFLKHYQQYLDYVRIS
ncbi:MAG: ATP-dependent DNA helicase RecG [Fidelibacterota bacterium]